MLNSTTGNAQRELTEQLWQSQLTEAGFDMTFKNLSDEARRKIEAVAAAEGAQTVRAEPTLETLEDVFIRTVGLPAKKAPEKKE